MAEQTEHHIIEQVSQWLDDVVIGLNLCPFAQKPRRAQQIHLQLYTGQDDKELLHNLYQALVELEQIPSQQRDTTLLICPNMLLDFEDYNQFLDDAQWLLERSGYEGTFQIASFHPHYQFAGTHKQDKENLTNRAPYPIFHILREASLATAIDKYPNPEQIPETNIRTVEQLDEAHIALLFPWTLDQTRKN